ncbi:ubiquitin carboxyl-terminal hydrolase 47-like [Gouania willdenowi]|nr:ubiquitin carboxyl-terminal hydrolase 47-like [Gouania willdenowi]
MRRSDRNKPNYGDFSPSDADRKHHGLLNQGGTCYLNSVLQVLFMTKDFRDAVKRGTSEMTFIDPELKALFQDLEKYPAYTYRITKKLGIEMVHEQRDAAEFFERILEMTDSEAKQIFRGLLAHFVCCDKCGKESVQDQQFWYLPLSLGNNSAEVYRVEDGIEEFLRTLTFTEENQIYCDNCNAKTNCTEGNKVTYPPDVLTLLLKRFHFNLDTKSSTKNNRKVLIPFTLNNPESYQLYAVVEHSGELRNGHYVSIIQTDEDRWFCFNDEKVSRVQQQFKDGPIMSSTAYLLFYRKETSENQSSMKVDDSEVKATGQGTSKRLPTKNHPLTEEDGESAKSRIVTLV